jgi:hypothetical protein
MPQTVKQDLPQAVIDELISIRDAHAVHFKRVDPTDSVQLETSDSTVKSIGESISSTVFITSPIKAGYSTGSLNGGSKVTYTNFGNVSSTTVLSAIYEHVRGYLWRDFSSSADILWNAYLASTAGTNGLVVSKSSGNGLTAFRAFILNRDAYGDAIMPGTLRIDIQPTNVNFVGKIGLDFGNDDQSDSTSGDWAAVTGMAGLTGSLLNRGVSSNCFSNAISMNQKTVSAFTIAMRVKFINGGPDHQTLLHRRVGNPSLSALGNNFSAGSGVNQAVVTNRYSDFNSMSATVTPQNTSFFLAAGYGMSIQQITGGTSAIFSITNDGGGRLYWKTTDTTQNDFYKGCIRFSPWYAWNYNPGFVAGIGTNNGLTGWVRSDGSVYDSSTGAAFSHGATGGYANRFDALGITSYMSIIPGGGDQYLYHRISAASTKNSYGVHTPAFAVENGCDRLIIHFDATVSGDLAGSSVLSTAIIATNTLAGADAPNSISAVAISSYSSFFTDGSSVSAISLTCELKNGVDRKLDHSGIDLWFKIGSTRTSGMFYAVDNFQCEYVPATIYGIGNRNSTTATLTAYIDSSITAGILNPGNLSPQQVEVDFSIIDNHPWISCPNFPINCNFNWSTGIVPGFLV